MQLLASLALASLATAAVQDSPGEAPADLTWFEGTYPELLALAAESERPIYLHFWATWNRPSLALKASIEADPDAIAALSPYLCYELNVLRPDNQPMPLAQRFNAVRPPKLVFLNADGSIRDFIDAGFTDVMSTADFVAHVARVQSGEGTLTALRAAVAEKPEDLELRFELALRLRAVGDTEGFDQQVAEIKKLDPEGASGPLRTLKFEGLRDILYDRQAAGPRREKAAAELRAFIEAGQQRELEFESWKALGTYYQQDALNAKRRYQHKKARELVPEYAACWRKAMAMATDDEWKTLGPYVPVSFYEFRDYLSEEDRAFALEVGEKAMKLFPEDVDVMDALACALYMNGKAEEALALAQKALRTDPRNWILQERIKEFQQ